VSTASNNSRERGCGRVDWDVWVRRSCALIVAAVAAYGSYEHQRAFALRGGADATSAALWPLSVDGLLVLATVGLLKSTGQTSRRTRWAVWSAFGLGIAVSLAANIAAAPVLAWQPVLVAGWPPVALLLAVELLTHRSNRRESTEPVPALDEIGPAVGSGIESEPAMTSASDAEDSRFADGATAEAIMWEYYQQERSRGRVPTGAELICSGGCQEAG
jgi:hypothetical protein